MRKRTKRVLGAVVVIGAVGVAMGAAKSAGAMTAPSCKTFHATITKTDEGHGIPAEWADLVMHRTTKVCGDNISLEDNGVLWTRAHAGTPNGTGGEIARRVPGKVHGTYALTVSNGVLKPGKNNGDVTLKSTAYVQSLFASGTVTGGAYSWEYTTTRCGEKWTDSSTNQDGQGADAGNITGKRCEPTPKPSDSVTPIPSTPMTTPPVSGPPVVAVPPGEAPRPIPVTGDLPVTG